MKLYTTEPISADTIAALMSSFGSLGTIVTRCSDELNYDLYKLTICAKSVVAETIVERNAKDLNVKLY